MNPLKLYADNDDDESNKILYSTYQMLGISYFHTIFPH